MKLRTGRHTCSEGRVEPDTSDRPLVADASLLAVDEAIMRMRARHIVAAQEVVDLLLDLRSTVALDAALPPLGDSASVS